jgi:hypothetical protein
LAALPGLGLAPLEHGAGPLDLVVGDGADGAGRLVEEHVDVVLTGPFEVPVKRRSPSRCGMA